MDKESFYEILCRSTPEDLNEFIHLKGTQKMVNAVTFMHSKKDKEENDNDKIKSGYNGVNS